MTNEERTQFEQVLATKEYDDFSDGGKYHHILDLLFNTQISPGKAAEAIAEISLGVTPRLPEPRYPPRWGTTAPTEPGFYWYRDFYTGSDGVHRECRYVAMLNEHGLFELTGIGEPDAPEAMLRNGGEFWSEKLEEPE